jgi:hypothetical protein
MALRADPDGIAPERALVFEVAGSLSDFYSQAQQIHGLEFLLDEEIEFEPDDDFHRTRQRDGTTIRVEQAVGGRLYMAMPDLRALREILSLWDRHRRRQALPYGFSSWGTLFGLLRNLRAWGPQDRVLPETLQYWRERIEDDRLSPVRFEIELWFYESADRRQAVGAAVGASVEGLGGLVVSAISIAPIRYHGMLIELPPERIQELLGTPNVTLARLDEIMYLRPQSVASFPIVSEEEGEPLEASDSGEEEAVTAPPIAALLDGMPVENHVCLRGRLIIDDPEGFADFAPVDVRQHGTSMASLILHGDLQTGGAPLDRPLVVRPVMTYDGNDGAETTPRDRFPLDIVYQAVRRMLEGDAGADASAPSVVVINLSLGDLNRPFAGRLSPWARLLDWLSFRHRVLFLVSAGNTRSWLPVRSFASRAEFLTARAEVREDRILEALNSEKAARTILSPAEGLNAIAVGAWHADEYAAAPSTAYLVDPFPTGGLPNISSAVGLGHRRTIKPDLLYDGGRELVRPSEDEGCVWLAADAGGRYAGQLAAAPDSTGTGRLNIQRRSVGTSNAAALLTRAAARIHESIVETGTEVPRSHQAVLLKALLVHGAAWGEAGQRLENLFGPPGRGYLQRRENVARFLGYGRPNIERVLDCTTERATLFGFGDLERDTEDDFDIPLPASLEGAPRRVVSLSRWRGCRRSMRHTGAIAPQRLKPCPLATKVSLSP